MSCFIHASRIPEAQLCLPVSPMSRMIRTDAKDRATTCGEKGADVYGGLCRYVCRGQQHCKEETGPIEETTPSSSSSSWLKDWRKEVEDDLRSAWPEETFSRTEASLRLHVINEILVHELKPLDQAARAAVLVALTYSWRVSRCVKGACEIAGLLVFALSSGMQRAQLEDGEADAFWCLSQLLADAQEEMSGTPWDNDALAAQARRLLILHRCFDYPVAKLLEDHGLVAMPALRLGALLLCRAGFSLLQAARLWDSILADPRRFQFADTIVIALLLLRRGDLLQRDDVGGLAESLVTAPQTVDFDTILSTAYAVCAFQRRHGPDSGAPYPPRSSVHSAEGALDLDSAVNAAQEGLSSLWGKVRAAGQLYAWQAHVSMLLHLLQACLVVVHQRSQSRTTTMAPAQDAEVLDACNYLAQRLRHLRAEGKYCDVVLVAADTRMEAHRAVLATAGSAWQQALQSEGGGRWQGSAGKIEAQPPAELRFPHCARPELLRLLIDHIYGATTTDQLAALVQGSEGSCREDMQLFDALGPSPSSELPSLRLARRLSTLRRQCIFCDTVLTTGQGQALAHRAVLAAGSEALDRYFSEQIPHPGFGGLDAVELALAAVAASSLEALVDRLYLGPVAGLASADFALLETALELRTGPLTRPSLTRVSSDIGSHQMKSFQKAPFASAA
eukprot:s2417_g10.t1